MVLLHLNILLTINSTLGLEVARVVVGIFISFPRYIATSITYDDLASIECALVIFTAAVLVLVLRGSERSPSTVPRPSRPERARAVRDRILIGKDTYNYRHTAFGSLDEQSLLSRPGQAAMPHNGLQVHSSPIIHARSPFDPILRTTDVGRNDEYANNEIQIRHEVRIEMEDIPQRLSGAESPTY